MWIASIEPSYGRALRRRPELVCVAVARYEQVIRPTDWNDMLLKVEGNHMVAILNGVTVLDFTDPAPKSSDGYIALQLHSGGLGNMRFKDIVVRDLSVR